ncbi:uncharacterized protein ACB058_020177 [Synchiropus picturatus]
MSVSMSTTDGVTVFTVTSDPSSSLPPLFQILKGMCYNPVCCTLSENLRRLQGRSQSILGALHIMVGFFNIGLGPTMLSTPGGSSGFAFWLGGMFILFGIFCILSERYPSPCLVIINVILNLSGVGFAIAGAILYGINIATTYFWSMCEEDFWEESPEDVKPTSTSSSQLMESCLEAKSQLIMILQTINSLLIILSALELCLSISSSVLGIKALKKRQDPEEKTTCDPEICSPLMEQDHSRP